MQFCFSKPVLENGRNNYYASWVSPGWERTWGSGRKQLHGITVTGICPPVPTIVSAFQLISVEGPFLLCGRDRNCSRKEDLRRAFNQISRRSTSQTKTCVKQTHKLRSKKTLPPFWKCLLIPQCAWHSEAQMLHTQEGGDLGPQGIHCLVEEANNLIVQYMLQKYNNT